MNPQHYITHNPQQQQCPTRSNIDTMEVYGTQSRRSTLSSIDRTIPPLLTWTPPSSQELQFYESLFATVDQPRRHAIGGQQAVAFFTRSHLDKAVLREIWNLADSQQKSELSRNEFYVAMRLISMAQHGEQVSLQKFYELATVQYPLAKLDGVSPPRELHQTVTQIPIPTPATTQLYAPQQGYGAVKQQQSSSSGLIYALTADEKSKYEVIFQQYDTDHDGFLLGAEAVALFHMSGLDRNILREIWSMADVTQDSKLSIQEFYVAMHLIVCLSKRGLPMPSSLPCELKEAAFGAAKTATFVPSHGCGSHVPPSQDGLSRLQQKSMSPPKPEGMSAFDLLGTAKDIPLPSLSLSTPPSLQESSYHHTDIDTRNSHLQDSSNPSVHTPAGILHGKHVPPTEQYGINSFPTSRPPSVVDRDCANVASSSMNSGLTPVAFQQPIHQLHSRNVDSNDRVQQQSDDLGFQSYPALGRMGFSGPQASVASSAKPFMGGEEEKKLAGKLDQQNHDVVQAIVNVERKQSMIEMVLEKIRDLDELRHELVTLVLKRNDMRAALAFASESSDSSAEHTRYAVERSLGSLVKNQKLLVDQLQHDICKYEGELEEAILSAKLQQKLSLESRSSSINAATPSLSAHDFSRPVCGETTMFTGTPLIIDGSNALPSPVAVPSAPSVSAFSPDATDSSGFNAFSNFDSAPRSLASATPSPAGAVAIPSGSFFSPTPSPSQSVSKIDTFNAFGDFAAPSSAGVVPSALSDIGSIPDKPSFSPTFSPAAVSNSAEFGDCNAAAPLFAADAGIAPSMQAASDAASPFSSSLPSQSPVAMNDGVFFTFDGCNTASSLPEVAAKSSPAMIASSTSSDFSLEPILSDIAAPVILSTRAHESSGFSPTTSSAMTDIPVFDAFDTAPLSNSDTTTSANTAVATDILIVSPVVACNNGFDVFTTAVSTDNVTEPSELASKQESTRDLLFSVTPSVAATESTGFDTFDDIGSSLPSSGSSTMAVHTSEETTESSLFSLVATDGNDFDDFGDFNAAPASADSTAPLFALNKSAKVSSTSLSSPVANDDAGSDFGEFSAAPILNDAAATPCETLQTTYLPEAGDSGEVDDFSDYNSIPVKRSGMKNADASDNGHFSPVSRTIDVCGDMNVAPICMDSAKPAATSDRKRD